MKKMYVIMLVAMLTCGTLLTGCGDDSSSSRDRDRDRDTQTTDESDGDRDRNRNDDADVANDDADVSNTDNDTAGSAGGATETGSQTYELTQNDVMHSVFFDLKVNSVSTADELEEWVPNEGYTFLIVNVSITNTFSATDPMSYADFPVLWGDPDAGEGTYPDSDFSTAFPDEYEIAVGETVTSDLIYTIPADVDEVILEYYDLWDNGEEGDTFNMHIPVK